MGARAARVGLWCTPVAILCFAVALGPLAHFTPPPSPQTSAKALAESYRLHRTGVIVGCALYLASGTLLAPITALFSVFIRAMERRPPFLTYLQLVTGGVALVLFVPSAIFWGTAAFRPDRAPDLILLLNDLGWLAFIWVVWPGILQVIVLGVAILQDRGPGRLFPTWVGYFNLVGVPVLLLSSLAPLAMSGPFAWNGALTHYVPVTYFLGWWIVMFVCSLRALKSPRLDLAGLGAAATGGWLNV